MMRQLVTAPQVSIQLGHSVGWFYRNRARLEDRHGFPRAVDGCGMRWDPAAIAAWLDARVPATKGATQGAPADAEQILIARARQVSAEVERASLAGAP